MNREPVQIHKRKSFSAKDRARIFAAHSGVCYLSGVKIGPSDTWDVEHVIPLALGGTNEDENLRPALVDPHRVKSKADVRSISKAKRLEARENGTRRERKKIPSRPFDKTRTRKFNGKVEKR